MIDLSLVRSGFDAEILISARYLRYFLLSFIETGTLPTRFNIENPALTITIRPPQDYEQLYEPHPEAEPLAAQMVDAFDIEILFDDEHGADLRMRMRIDVELDGKNVFVSADQQIHLPRHPKREIIPFRQEVAGVIQIAAIAHEGIWRRSASQTQIQI